MRRQKVWVSQDLHQRKEKGHVYNFWVHSGAHRVNLTRHLEQSRDREVTEPRRGDIMGLHFKFLNPEGERGVASGGIRAHN
jgi:hypothetical protein